MKVETEVTGLGDALLKLEQVDQRVSLNLVRAAMRFAMKPAIDKAKQLVPYNAGPNPDNYHLRDHIGVRAEKKKARLGNATVMRFGAATVSLPAGHPRGLRIAGGLSKSKEAPNYALIVNKDTPFIEPALEQTEAQVVKRFGDKLIQAVSKL